MKLLRMPVSMLVLIVAIVFALTVAVLFLLHAGPFHADAWFLKRHPVHLAWYVKRAPLWWTR